jgi:hypothetical protein
MRLNKPFIIAIFACSLPGLVATTSMADEQHEEYQPSARHGAELWANTCARCHNLRRTDEFSDRQWIPVVSHMRIRAGLTGNEARDILSFLQASNSRD